MVASPISTKRAPLPTLPMTLIILKHHTWGATTQYHDVPLPSKNPLPACPFLPM